MLRHLNRRPFVPFTIHVADGMSISVPSIEFIKADVVMVRNREGVRTIEVSDSVTGRKEVIDLLLVTRLSFSPGQD
jgi:hypothetical protein